MRVVLQLLSTLLLVLVSSSVVHGFLIPPRNNNNNNGRQLHDTVNYAITKSTGNNDGTTNTNNEDDTTTATKNKLSANTIYLDIDVAGNSVGRLIFHLTNPSPLPLHAENIIQLVKGSRRGIDPKAHYVGCEFDYSPASIEDGMGRYRWGHQLRGRGRNAIGRADVPINDPVNQLANTHTCYGGQYYGDKYVEPDGGHTWEEPGVLLTVPVLGPGHGSSKFSIVRVGESPKEWGERLLMNSGVIGYLDSNCLEVLHAMARQTQGPPTVVAAGVLDEDEEYK